MPAATDESGGEDVDLRNVRRKWQKSANSNEKGLTKVISIEEAGMISPLMLGKTKEVDEFNLDAPQQEREKPAKRSTGRLVHHTSSPSLHPLNAEIKSHNSVSSGKHVPSDAGREEKLDAEAVLEEIAAWLHREKNKQKQRKGKTKPKLFSEDKSKKSHRTSERSRRESDASDASVDLGGLEAIVKKRHNLNKGDTQSKTRSSQTPRRASSFRKLRRLSIPDSSDTEYGETMVPSCNVVLDNSRTLNYFGGLSNSRTDLLDGSQGGSIDKDAWLSFKFEIVRLTHTLRLRGWRQIPLDKSDKVSVERLSGALTNAIYVVSPPRDLSSIHGDEETRIRRSQPKKLLLRIYGPQVDHLIDRDAELQIMQRLCRKNIGPRLLGTFRNGRFEEYLNAKALKPQDLRDPQTSIQIAKRMRELHEGVDLLEEERDRGPFVWQNWDKWVDRVEKIITFIDQQIMAKDSSSISKYYKDRGFVCGVEWPLFRSIVERFRKWLNQQYGGTLNLRNSLVFAHNDTQYGNILRLEPSGESPLLLPANVHRQLVVIDFEYANANTPGFDIVNHFSEWCYNYHDPTNAHFCNTTHYPTPGEQRRFIKAYLGHRPHFATDSSGASGATTPQLSPQSSGPTRANSVASALASFTFDARMPAGKPKNSFTDANAEDSADNAKSESESDSKADVKRLMYETRLWRIACSAQWVAWGIVQAQVPGMPVFEDDTGQDFEVTDSPLEDLVEEKESFFRTATNSTDDVLTEPATEVSENGYSGEGDEEGADSEDFDYLSYARDRAMLFWGDCVQMGFIREEDLPADVLRDIKMLAY